MTTPRILNSIVFLQPTDDEPIRSVVTQSKEAVVVAWCIKQGQRIPLHVHPHGQDTWTVLAGKGHYYLDNNGTTRPIMADDIVVAHTGEVHGVYNDNPEPLVFISVVSPADAGYRPV
ncbi:MAG: cupin domain-containing protein [Methylobacter sp.]|nr:cupin domain-containing protein [Methylobacter sp.]